MTVPMIDAQLHRRDLLHQIARDLETLKDTEPVHPSRAFYEERIASYREEYQR